MEYLGIKRNMTESTTQTEALYDEMDDDFDEEKFEHNTRKMNELFPNLMFSCDPDDYEQLDDELLPNKEAIIYHTLKCICCAPEREGAEVIHIKRNHNITYRDFYQECNNNWSNELCDHSFLEGINITNNIQITLDFGS